MTQPSKREIFRPAELIILSAVLALFVGLAVLLTTRSPLLAVIFFGVAFIVVIVMIAMMALTFKPNKDEQSELDEDGAADGGAAGAAGDVPPPPLPSTH